MVAGNFGLCLCCVSQSGYLRFTLTSDDNVLDDKENKRFMQLIYENIATELQRVGAAPDVHSGIAESKKEK